MSRPGWLSEGSSFNHHHDSTAHITSKSFGFRPPSELKPQGQYLSSYGMTGTRPQLPHLNSTSQHQLTAHVEKVNAVSLDCGWVDEVYWSFEEGRVERNQTSILHSRRWKMKNTPVMDVDSSSKRPPAASREKHGRSCLEVKLAAVVCLSLMCGLAWQREPLAHNKETRQNAATQPLIPYHDDAFSLELLG